MKKIDFTKFSALTIIVFMVIGSCSTHRQVACPPPEQKKELVREIKKANNRTSYFANRGKNNTANKYYRSKNREITKPCISARESIEETDFINPDDKKLEFITPVNDNIVASLTNDQNLHPSPSLQSIARLNEKKSNLVSATTIDLGDKKEQRKINRDLKKELKKGFRAAQSDVQQGPTKQAMPLAIASLVLGIVSFIIFAIPAGILSIVFGAIALTRIKNNPNQPGKGMALAGMICGIVGMGLYLILLATML